MLKPELVLFDPDGCCLAMTNNKKRCKNAVRKSDRIAATRLIHRFNDPPCSEELDNTIIDLLLCGTHEGKWEGDSTFRDRFRRELIEWVSRHDPLAPIVTHESSASHTDTVNSKLIEPINENEDLNGSVYVFETQDMPEMRKIGYTKDGKKGKRGKKGNRVGEWGACHARPRRIDHSAPVLFPHRLEELVHLELAADRYDVACPIAACKNQIHIEWFKSSLSKIKDVISEWCKLFNEYGLYDEDMRMLHPCWDAAVRSLNGQGLSITAQRLLEFAQNEHLEDNEDLADALAAIDIADPS